MKKLLIILILSATIVSCNSNGKTEVANDTLKVGEKNSAGAQQSNVDTNVNKIGTTPVVTDTLQSDTNNKR
jgi:hypothetical protein